MASSIDTLASNLMKNKFRETSKLLPGDLLHLVIVSVWVYG